MRCGCINREVSPNYIRNIIERFDLNKNLDMKDKIYLVSPNFIEEKIKKIFEIPGELGFTVRIGLLTGLREQEIIYIKEKSVCNDGYGCDCEKLHTVNLQKWDDCNINWLDKRKQKSTCHNFTNKILE